MTLGGHIVYLSREGANDATMHKLYTRQNHVIMIIINTQGQFEQIYFIRKDCLT